MGELEIEVVRSRKDLRAFVRFPWRVYRDDPNWVPPLVTDRLRYLDPKTGPFYREADIALFLARRRNEVVGTIAAFVPHRRIALTGRPEGGFGFFEVLEDYAAARALLDAACAWLRERGMERMRGPTSFSDHECPGVLIAGADSPPAMLEAHTPPYYRDFLERYGMEKDHDLYAWRAPLWTLGPRLEHLPPEIERVAAAARKQAGLTIRKARLEAWPEEVVTAHYLFNETLKHLPDFVPISQEEFRRLAEPLRDLIDPDVALFAELDGKPIGFCVAIPDINRVLLHLKGRLFPLGWLQVKRLMRQVDVLTFKLMGVLERFRRRGIDALLYLEAVKAACVRGYRWLEGSVTSEWNPVVNRVAERLGAERYKHFRLYQMAL
ncbi:MAG: GNAT family N-acetyltransferase [Chloroflexia bacterium]